MADPFGHIIALHIVGQAGREVERRLGLAQPRNVVALAFDGEQSGTVDRRGVGEHATVHELALRHELALEHHVDRLQIGAAVMSQTARYSS